MKIHYKLVLTLSVIIAFTLTLIFFYLDRNLNDNYVEQLKENIKRQALLCKFSIDKTNIPDEALQRYILEISKDLALRISFIDKKGKVLADSSVDMADLASLENHLYRPEIQDAINKGEGWSKRFSTTLKKDILYYALPLKNGFIRLAIPISRINIISLNIEDTLLLVLLTAFVLTSVTGFFAFNSISKPLRLLSAKAREIAKGDFKKLNVKGKDEVANLSESLNYMVEQLKARIDEIKENNSRFEAVLLSMFEGIMVIDSNCSIKLINDSLREILKIEGSSIGKRPIEIIRNLEIQQAAELVLKEHGLITKEINIAYPHKKNILIHATPVLRNDEILGAVMVFNDISELRKLENIRKDFVANVSHELRTPISNIKGYTETLLDGAIEEKETTLDFLNIINVESERLANLINDILSLSKIEADNFKLELKTSDLYDLAGEAISAISKLAAEKAIKIENKINSIKIKVDSNLIIQVLVNLLHNAVKYSPEGKTVLIETIDKQNFVEIKIIDEGIGIPEKDLGRLFERFYRVDKARSKEQGGTGLGLSIAKHIVQVHRRNDLCTKQRRSRLCFFVYTAKELNIEQK